MNLFERIAMMLRRGAVVLVDDSKPMQTAQIQTYAGDLSDAVEHFQPYGFSSIPTGECEAVVACINGNPDHQIALVFDDRSKRPTGGQPGEVTVYDDQGSAVKLARGGALIANGSQTVTVQAGTSITLVVGVSSITISATGIVITGPSGIPLTIT